MLINPYLTIAALVASPSQCAAPIVYEIDANYAANKQLIVQSAKEMGASDLQTALILAMAMAETNTLEAKDRDCSKDCAMGARNWSCFNVNSDMLTQLGWDERQTVDLNEQSNVKAVISWILVGFREWGEDRTMAFHRGGRSGFQNFELYGAREYIEAMRAVAAQITADPKLLEDSRRVCFEIPHV